MTDAIARPTEIAARPPSSPESRLSPRLSPRLVLRLILSAALLAALFCISPASGETLWENGGEYVKTETHGGRANNHPFKIDPDLLGKALKNLRVEPVKTRDVLAEEDKDPTLPLFTPATAQRLARYIAEGLRNIGPDEDVVFRSVDTAPLFGKVIGKQVFVSARVFWRDRRLNVIFGKIHKNVKRRWLYGQEKGWVNPPEPGVRGKATALGLRVVEAPGVGNLRTRDGRKRIDWIVIEPRTLAEAEIGAEIETDSDTPRATGERPRTKDRGSPRTRLKRLRELRDEDLISEQEYRRKRARILEEL